MNIIRGCIKDKGCIKLDANKNSFDIIRKVNL